MIDDRLEARLRLDPTNDPIHEVGAFHDRLAVSATQAIAPRRSLVLGLPIGVAAVFTLAIAVLIVMRPAPAGPLASPSPRNGGSASPAATPSGTTVDGAAIDTALRDWASANSDVAVVVTILGKSGDRVHLASGPDRVDPPAGASVRLGETARLLIAGAMTAPDECGRGLRGAPACKATGDMTRFRLDDPISRWLPAWPSGDPTPVRDLLDGSTGLSPVGPTIADLRDRMSADPSADWSRASLLAAAIAAPRRFEPGTRREPVDTESMLLEDVIARVTGEPTSVYLGDVVGHAFGSLGQTPALDQSPDLLSGQTPAGERLTDLDPSLRAIVGEQGATAASSEALALLGAETWALATTYTPSDVHTLVDAAHGRLSPIAGRGICPCTSGIRSVVLATGHAVGWSSLAAYDFDRQTGLGIVVARDVSDSALEQLVGALLPLVSGG